MTTCIQLQVHPCKQNIGHYCEQTTFTLATEYLYGEQIYERRIVCPEAALLAATQVVQGLEWVKDNFVTPAVVVMALGGKSTTGPS